MGASQGTKKLPLESRPATEYRTDFRVGVRVRTFDFKSGVIAEDCDSLPWIWALGMLGLLPFNAKAPGQLARFTFNDRAIGSRILSEAQGHQCLQSKITG